MNTLLVRRLAKSLMKERLIASGARDTVEADHSDCQSATLACSCESLANYAKRRSKTFISTLGEMTLRRANYHFNSCNCEFYPRNRALGLESASLSRAAIRMRSLSAAWLGFGESCEVLWELAGLRIDAKCHCRLNFPSFWTNKFCLSTH